MIKRIGTEARHDLEKFFGTKVFLDLRVKVNADVARQRPRPRRHRRAEDGDQAVEGVAPFEETENLRDGPEYQVAQPGAMWDGVKAFAGELLGVVRWIAGVAGATLPKRWWPVLDPYSSGHGLGVRSPRF